MPQYDRGGRGTVNGIVETEMFPYVGWLVYNMGGIHMGESRNGKGRDYRLHEDAECVIMNKKYFF